VFPLLGTLKGLLGVLNGCFRGEKSKMVKNILISGYYGFDNAGDELILTAILAELKKIPVPLKTTVLSAHPSKTRRFHQVEAVPRWRILGVVRSIRESDLLISGGGGLLQDVTNRASILYYLVIIWLARVFRKKVVIYAQGIGPIQSKFNRLLTKGILNGVNLLIVRDENSKQVLRSLGVQREITVTADPTLTLEPVIGHPCPPTSSAEGDFVGRRPKPQRRRGSSVIGNQLPTVGICVRKWKNFTGGIIAEAADYLIKNQKAKVIFIPFHLPADYLFARKLKNLMHEKAEIEVYQEPLDLLGIFSKVNLVISMRLHGLILAGLLHIPMLGISIDPKIVSFSKSLGQETVSPTVGKKELIDEIEKIWAKRDSYSRKIQEKLPSLQEKARINAHLLSKVADI